MPNLTQKRKKFNDILIGFDVSFIIEIIQLVSNVPIYPNDPFRPVIDDGKESCCDVNNLMIKGWSEDPLDRPDFSTIKSMIRKINKLV